VGLVVTALVSPLFRCGIGCYIGIVYYILLLSLSFELPSREQLAKAGEGHFRQALGKDVGLLVVCIDLRDENAFTLSIWVVFGWAVANLALEPVIANGNVLGARS
jgi:hypothetical protein